MPIVLADIPVISAGDVDFPGINGTPYLDAGETFTGTPTITEAGIVASYDDDADPVYTASAHLTITNKAVNTAAVTVKNKLIAIGMAVQCKIVGQQAGNTYGLRVSVATSEGRTKVFDCLFVVK